MDNGPSWLWRLVEKIFGACILIAASAYLLKCAAGWLYSIRWPLLIIGILAVLIIVAVRIYLYRRSQRWRSEDETLD